MRRSLLVLATAGLLLAACAADEGVPPVDDGFERPADEAPDADTDADTDGNGNGGSDDDAAGGTSTPILGGETAAAIAALADAEGVDTAEIEVVAAEPVTWSDGSLGCPEDGGMYTQALVEGYRIVLTLDGSEVAYHGQDGGSPFRCDTPQDPADQRM